MPAPYSRDHHSVLQLNKCLLIIILRILSGVNLIKPISRKYYPVKPGLAGSGGYEKWVFAIKNPIGFVVPYTTSITLLYARPWDLQGARALNFKVVTTYDN